MRQKRKSTKLSLGKQTLISIRIQVGAILEALHKTEIELVGLKAIARSEGNFVLAHYLCASDPDNQRGRLFAVKRFGRCCDVWMAGPGADDEFPNDDVA